MNDPAEAFAAQVDLSLRWANDLLLDSAKTWHAVFKAQVDTCDAARRSFGGLLVDWHEGFFHAPRR
jgi:hypothetical protein